MSIKSTAASLLFSVEDHQWVYGARLRFQMRTQSHIQLSLLYPQEGGRQLIHLKACEHHLLLSWVKGSIILSKEASFHLSSTDNSWTTFCSYFQGWNHSSSQTASPYETGLTSHLLAFLLWKGLLNLQIISGSLLKAGAVWELSQAGCIPGGQLCLLAQRPPPSQGDLSFLMAAEAAVHHNLSLFPCCPFPFCSLWICSFPAYFLTITGSFFCRC